MSIKESHLKPAADYRFERKFRIEHLSKAAVASIIHLHPAAFRRSFPPRQVNNLYYDTPGFGHYHENLDGTSIRQKYRIRWYGPTQGNVDSPVLEIKSKNGQLGTKDVYSLPGFQMDVATYLPGIRITEGLPGRVKSEWSGQVPTLMNAYHREYYVSADKRFRLTLDSELRFWPVHGARVAMAAQTQLHNVLIVELKYEEQLDAVAHQLSSAFPFRVTKSSKYASGIEEVWRL